MFSLDKSCRKFRLTWLHFKMEGFLPTSTLFPWPQHYYYHYFLLFPPFHSHAKTEKMWFRNAHFKLVIFVSTQYFRIFRASESQNSLVCSSHSTNNSNICFTGPLPIYGVSWSLKNCLAKIMCLFVGLFICHLPGDCKPAGTSQKKRTEKYEQEIQN